MSYPRASGPHRRAPRRDRRGRGVRGPLAWPPVPAMSSRAQAFDDLVMESAERLEAHWSVVHPDLEFAVEDVPASDVAPWEGDAVPLGRVFGAHRDRAPRIVIYRRPIETRSFGRKDLAAFVADIVTEQVAGLLGVRPEQIDPGWQD